MKGEPGCQDGPGLIVGAVVGIRRWKVANNGDLRGITYQQPWVSGENVAECWRTKAKEVQPTPHLPHSFHGVPAASMMIWGWGTWHSTGVTWNEAGEPSLNNVGHERDDCGLPIGRHDDCGHGFYAYTQDKHVGATSNWSGLSGVVEGYGRMLLGSNGGFKASKARIVALHMPPVEEFLSKPGGPVVDVEKETKDRAYWTRMDKAVRARYPEVLFYSTRAEMLYYHELSDISHLVGPQEDEAA